MIDNLAKYKSEGSNDSLQWVAFFDQCGINLTPAILFDGLNAKQVFIFAGGTNSEWEELKRRGGVGWAVGSWVGLNGDGAFNLGEDPVMIDSVVTIESGANVIEEAPKSAFEVFAELSWLSENSGSDPSDDDLIFKDYYVKLSNGALVPFSAIVFSSDKTVTVMADGWGYASLDLVDELREALRARIRSVRSRIEEG